MSVVFDRYGNEDEGLMYSYKLYDDFEELMNDVIDSVIDLMNKFENFEIVVTKQNSGRYSGWVDVLIKDKKSGKGYKVEIVMMDVGNTRTVKMYVPPHIEDENVIDMIEEVVKNIGKPYLIDIYFKHRSTTKKFVEKIKDYSTVFRGTNYLYVYL